MIHLPDTWPIMLAIIVAVFFLAVTANLTEYITRRRWWAPIARMTVVVVGSAVLLGMILWMMGRGV